MNDPAKLDVLLAKLEALSDPTARDLARELAAELLRVHGEALAEILAALRAEPSGARTIESFARSERVSSVLLLHDLHPASLEARVREALARGGANLRARGSSVELVAVRDRVVELRAIGAEHLRDALGASIEDLVVEAAPDATDVVIAWEAPVDPGLIPISALKSRAKDKATERATDACEMCGVALPKDHDHVVERGRRTLVCACLACALLFDADRQTPANHGKTRVARHIEKDANCMLDDAEWSALGIPVSVAFFVARAGGAMTACYPGPAGVIESPVSSDAWARIVATRPRLSKLAPDTEALLICRHAERAAAHLVSVDLCFELAGLLRHHWKGLSGGARAWTEVATFFDRLEPANTANAHA